MGRFGCIFRVKYTKTRIIQMRKVRNDHSGFSVVEVVLVLVIVGLIGVVGFMVYKNHNKKLATTSIAATTTTKSTTSTKTTTQAPTDPYAGWSTYTSKLEKLSIKYPAGWTVISNGDLFSILNNTSQEEDFSVESSAETLSSGTQVRANVTLNVATSGLTAGDCHGLVVHFATPVTVSGRNLTMAVLDSATEPGKILGVYVTDAQGLHTGSTTSTCQPSFASLHGNSNVFVNATFSRLPQPGDHSDGASIELTEAEYNSSSTVKQELKALQSLSY